MESYSLGSVLAARLTSEKTGSILPISRTFTLLGVYSYLQLFWTFLEHIKNALWCSAVQCSASTLSNLPLHPCGYN